MDRKKLTLGLLINGVSDTSQRPISDSIKGIISNHHHHHHHHEIPSSLVLYLYIPLNVCSI
jgi:hypothetical protein